MTVTPVTVDPPLETRVSTAPAPDPLDVVAMAVYVPALSEDVSLAFPAPSNWLSGLDRVGLAAVGQAEAKLARTTPIGTPIGTTPAGQYVGMYWQYGRAHYIRAHRLQCTATTPDGTLGRVDGGGSDDVGEFTLSGTYESLRLVLTKTYIAGTGDPRENKGHTVRLRLTLTDLHAVVPAVAAPPGTLGFFGTWHVRTSAYNGDAEMALAWPEQS